jgi:transposase IS66-like protein
MLRLAAAAGRWLVRAGRRPSASGVGLVSALAPRPVRRADRVFGTDRWTNLAALYSLIATCELNGVNPVAYLADVLLRVQTHPASRVDELRTDPENVTGPGGTR